VLLVFFIVYQQVENHLLQPLVYSRTVKLSSARHPRLGADRGGSSPGVLGALAAIRSRGRSRCSWSRGSSTGACGRAGPRRSEITRSAEAGRAGGPISVVCARSSRPARSRSCCSVRRSRLRRAPTRCRCRKSRGSASSSGTQLCARCPRVRGRPTAALRALELDVVGRINAQRGARGLRPLRVSRGLDAAAAFHSREMGHRASSSTNRERRALLEAHRTLLSDGAAAARGRSARTSSGSRPTRVPPVRSRVDGEPASPREHPRARVARGRDRRRALRLRRAGAYGGRSVTIVTADFGARG
jgi:hypothetical protein